MEDLNDKDTGHVLRRLPVDLFQLGLAIREDEFTREQLEYIPLFDIETGEIVTLWKHSESLDWITEGGWRNQEEWEKQQQIRQGIGKRYVEIPYTSHAEAHMLLEGFLDSLNSEEVEEAVTNVKGIGNTLLELQQFGIEKWQWNNYMQEYAEDFARDWLRDLGIESP